MSTPTSFWFYVCTLPPKWKAGKVYEQTIEYIDINPD